MTLKRISCPLSWIFTASIARSAYSGIKFCQEFFATRGDTLYAVIFGVEEWTKGQLIHAKYTHRCWGGVWAQESEFFLPNLYQISKYKHITLAHPLHILEIFSD